MWVCVRVCVCYGVYLVGVICADVLHDLRRSQRLSSLHGVDTSQGKGGKGEHAEWRGELVSLRVVLRWCLSLIDCGQGMGCDLIVAKQPHTRCAIILVVSDRQVVRSTEQRQTHRHTQERRRERESIIAARQSSTLIQSLSLCVVLLLWWLSGC
jgi:hypothetical protein